MLKEKQFNSYHYRKKEENWQSFFKPSAKQEYELFKKNPLDFPFYVGIKTTRFHIKNKINTEDCFFKKKSKFDFRKNIGYVLPFYTGQGYPNKLRKVRKEEVPSTFLKYSSHMTFVDFLVSEFNKQTNYFTLYTGTNLPTIELAAYNAMLKKDLQSFKFIINDPRANPTTNGNYLLLFAIKEGESDFYHLLFKDKRVKSELKIRHKKLYDQLNLRINSINF